MINFHLLISKYSMISFTELKKTSSGIDLSKFSPIPSVRLIVPKLSHSSKSLLSERSVIAPFFSFKIFSINLNNLFFVITNFPHKYIVVKFTVDKQMFSKNTLYLKSKQFMQIYHPAVIINNLAIQLMEFKLFKGNI